MKLIVDRTKWLRGEGSDVSRLLRPSDGKMCCLGFVCLAFGMNAQSITNVATPSSVADAKRIGLNKDHSDVPEALRWLLKERAGESIRDSDDCAELMRCNDLIVESNEWREAGITKIFKDHDIEVEFVN